MAASKHLEQNLEPSKESSVILCRIRWGDSLPPSELARSLPLLFFSFSVSFVAASGDTFSRELGWSRPSLRFSWFGGGLSPDLTTTQAYGIVENSVLNDYTKELQADFPDAPAGGPL
jgi:hypothetical protein